MSSGGDIEPCLRQFELLLLEDMGYSIDLTQKYESGQSVDVDVDGGVFSRGDGLRGRADSK